MTREEAYKLLEKHVKDQRMIQHCIASEAVMKAVAEKLGEDKEKWGIAGLLHDIDVDITGADPKTHGPAAKQILLKEGIDEDVIDAITMHNEVATGKERTTKFQHALAAGETITGLIKATALVYPGKKVTSVKPKSIKKRMKEKAFAASVKRENIMECEKIGIPLQEFIELSLNAMKSISKEIDL